MTSGKEDYLKAIYLISESHELVTNKELSNMLHVSPPSVSEMITKLQKQGYVDNTAYKGSKMTRKGRREAGRLLRYHSLWEVFLVEKLDFSWSEAHEIAEGLEHQTTEPLSERLDNFLDHPVHTPRGDPIPRKDGIRHSAPPPERSGSGRDEPHPPCHGRLHADGLCPGQEYRHRHGSDCEGEGTVRRSDSSFHADRGYFPELQGSTADFR